MSLLFSCIVNFSPFSIWPWDISQQLAEGTERIGILLSFVPQCWPSSLLSTVLKLPVDTIVSLDHPTLAAIPWWSRELGLVLIHLCACDQHQIHSHWDPKKDPLGRINTSPCLFADTSAQPHPLPFGDLPPTQHSHLGTKPNHAAFPHKDVLEWKIRTQAYHVTQGLLNFFKKDLCWITWVWLSIHINITHSHLPANLEKPSFPPLQIFSSVHFKSLLPFVYFFFHHLKVFHC